MKNYTRNAFITKVNNVLCHISSKKEVLDNVEALMESHYLTKLDLEHLKINQPFIFNLMVAVGTPKAVMDEDGFWHILGNDWGGEEWIYSGDSVIQPPEVPKCECGMENTWKAKHHRSCPPDKHSDWCKLYVSAK